MNNNKNDNNAIPQRKKIEKILIFVLSFLLCLSTSILGILATKGSLKVNTDVLAIIIIISIVFIALMFPVNMILTKKFFSKLSNMNAVQRQDLFLSKRENSAESAKTLLSTLKKARVFTLVYTLLLGVLSLFISFGAYVGGISAGTSLSLFSLGLINVIILRLKTPYTKKDIDEDETYISEKDFPTLYATAKKARDTLGRKGEIKIAIIPLATAGIAHIDGVYSIQLGTHLLNTISEEELYSVLLHEFYHIKWEDELCKCKKETDHYYNIIQFDSSRALLGSFFGILFSCFDSKYIFNFDLFKYASTLTAEENADKAMCEYGDKTVAASALVKIKYYDYYLWENEINPNVSIYTKETMPESFYGDDCEKYKKAIKENSKKWNDLIDVELLARSSTHPTTKMRITSLGVTETKTIDGHSSTEYVSEAKKALKHTDKLWLKFNQDLYEERKKSYLKDKETVEKWEAEGKPLVMEEYRFIIQALIATGKTSEAISLCDRAINELSSTAANFAYYIKGFYLVHKYDFLGVEYLYKSMDNHNNIDEGLELIGRFCCITGRQKELDEYREKALELSQKQIDEYSKLSDLSPKDILLEENLPDGMLEEILAYISKIDNGYVEKIYLVKKQITDTFSQSVFVVKILDEKIKTKAENIQDFYDKLFVFLDSFSDHQFGLFDYNSVKNIKLDSINNSVVYTQKDKTENS